MTPVVAGILLGAAGSVHCLAMCGPLVVAMRMGGGAMRSGPGAGRQAWGSIAAYHFARIATYAALGVLAGVAGQALALAHLGRALSIAAGLLLLGLALRRTGLTIGTAPAGRLTRVLSGWMTTARRVTAGRPIAGLLAAGAINAMLPCGLIYAALAAAAAMGSLLAAAGFMFAFGLGTLPALAAASLLADSVPVSIRSRLRLAVPAALAVVGMLLIVRGLPLRANQTHLTHATHRTP